MGKPVSGNDSGNDSGNAPVDTRPAQDAERLKAMESELRALRIQRETTRGTLQDAPSTHAENTPAGQAGGNMGSAFGLAMRISVEMLSAIAIGGLVGWGLDQWLGSRPWLLMVFLFLGGAAGILNVWRVMQGFDDGLGYHKSANPDKNAPQKDHE